MKKTAFLSILAIFLLFHSLTASAAYTNYTYNRDETVYIEPQAYTNIKTVDGVTCGTGSFSSPSDVFVAFTGDIYIADKDNNRIVILHSDYTVKRVVDKFENNGKTDRFSAPEGVFVAGDNTLFVADTANKRVVVLNADGSLKTTYSAPVEISQMSDFEFQPIRISVDNAGRLFIVSRNLSYGMLELDSEGNFVSFFGTTAVKRNFMDLIWNRILTREQKDNAAHNQPIEYSGNDIDAEGFIYGCVSAGSATSASIRRLNPMGVDVLRRTGSFDPMGDIEKVSDNGVLVSTQFVDICVNENGMYSALDQLRGRVFTYDADGNLLYVFGGKGDDGGELSTPCALDRTADGKYLVLDSTLNRIVIYSSTQYAGQIEKAVTYHYKREYADAENCWRKVLTMSTNNETAYVGVGKALFRQAEYESAMEYFKLGNDRELYSKAYSEYRREKIRVGFPVFVCVVLVLIAVFLIWRLVCHFLHRREDHS